VYASLTQFGDIRLVGLPGIIVVGYLIVIGVCFARSRK